ncbi:hypothetical protein Hypma_001157 [Hypsizygus marmoreus]|uniref:Uncharacterized protein n=1 Tax=Hypsizygus marmoreus TaxID=39966 RepID=A0A369J960_HYPMA|nr:hypothetical protein Hypma_001157 [Hypsizygus marmoreus]
MPEYRECLAHFLLLLWWVSHYKALTPLSLVALWADASKTEEAKIPGTRDGHVYWLDATSVVTRGTNGAQTWLWPSMWRKTSRQLNPPSIQTLSLRDITMTSRAVILDMGPLFLKLSYLTHTSVQIFRRNVWYTSVCGVDKKQRGFHVGLALEFGEFVIAFLSNDMVFQPLWTESKEKLPQSPPDVYTDYADFLTAVATWIQKRASGQNTRNGIACQVVREANETWSGIGVYTVCELFFDAGLSPFLTEAEVFDSPSRTA